MKRILVALSLACACATGIDRNNPFDPDNPNPAAGSIAGKVSLDEFGREYGEISPDQVTVTVAGLPDVHASASGEFRVENVGQGTWQVTLSAPYHQARVFEAVAVRPGAETDLGETKLLRGRGGIRGRVLLFGVAADGDHGGTLIEVRDHPREEPRFASTSPAGWFEIQQVIAGAHDLSILRQHYPGSSLSGVDVPADGSASIGELTLGSEAGAVAGRVLLEGRDPPHPDYQEVTVTLVGTGASTSALEDGTFLLATTLGGSFTLQASFPPRYAPARLAEVAVSPDGRTVQIEEPLRLALNRAAIAGRVAIPGETDLANVDVFVVGTSSRTLSDSAGAFRLEQVPAYPQTVQLFAQKITPSVSWVMNAPQTVQLAAGETADAGTLVLGRVGGDFGIEGRIYDPKTPETRFNTYLTRERWVRLDLARLNPDAYDEIRRAFSKDELAQLPFEPFVNTQVDCTQPGSGRENVHTCIELPAGDGQKDVWVELRLSASGDTVGPFRGTIKLDETAPERAPGAPAIEAAGGRRYLNAADGSNVEVALSAVDATSLVTAMKVWADDQPGPGGEPAAAEAYRVSTTLTVPGGDGVKYFHALFYDEAGNQSAHFSYSLERDTAVPVLNSLAASGVLGEPAGYTAGRGISVAVDADGTCSEQLWLLLSEDQLLARALRTPRTSDAAGHLGVSEAFTLDPGEGPHTVYAAVEDAAGNRSQIRSAAIVLDSVAPAGPVAAIAEYDSRPQNGATNSSTVRLELFVTTDTAQVEFAGCANISAPLPTGGQIFIQQDCDLGAPAGGEEFKVAVVRARDSAGNTSAAAAAGVLVDTLRPAMPPFAVLRSPGSVGSGQKFVNSRLINFQVDLSAAAEVPDQMQLYDRSPPGLWVPFAPAGVYVLQDEAQDVHVVSMLVRDRADNEAAAPATDPVILDTLSPPVPGLSSLLPAYNNEPASGPPDEQVSIAAMGPSEEANFWKFQVQGGTNCQRFENCELLSAGGGGITVQLADDSINIVRLRAVDKAGNSGSEALFLITHDDEQPPPPQIQEPAAAALSGDDTIRVRIGPASDNGPAGLAGFQGKVVENVAGADCSGGGWNDMAGSSEFLFDLPFINNLVCLRARDRAGNVSSPSAVQVEFDGQAPLAPVFSMPHTTNSDSVFLQLSDPPPGPPNIIAFRSGVPLDAEGHFHHFEVRGGPLEQWSCLPLLFDLQTGTWKAGPCELYDGQRHVYEVPLIQNAENEFFFRAVDAAGNAGPASLPVKITERSAWQLSISVASLINDARIYGDLVLWNRQTDAGSEPRGIHLFDLSKNTPGENADILVAGGITTEGVDISGRRVCWDDSSNATIYYCDLNATNVCTAPYTIVGGGGDHYPALSGNWILFNRSQNRLMAFDTSSGSLYELTTNLGGYFRYSYDVDRDLFAWVEGSGTNDMRVVVRRGTGQAVPVTSPNGVLFGYLSLADPWLVWSGGEVSQIYLERDPFAPRGEILTAGSSHTWPTIWRSGGLATIAFRDYVNGPSAFAVLQINEQNGKTWSYVQHLPEDPRTPFSMSLQRIVSVLHNELGQQAVYLWDLASNNYIDLDANNQFYPQVSGNRIAWLDQRTRPAGDVFLFDVSAGTIEAVTDQQLSAGSKRYLSFDADLLAWQENIPGSNMFAVFFYDLQYSIGGEIPPPSGGNCRCIAADGCIPRVSQGRVVWARNTNTDSDVCIFDPHIGTKILSGDSDWEDDPAINGNRVAWAENRRSVILCELDTTNLTCNSITCITGNLSGCLRQNSITPKRWPTEDNGRIAWVEAASLLLMDLANPSNVRTMLPASISDPQRPVLRKNWIVYLENIVPARTKARLVEVDSGASRTLMPSRWLQSYSKESPGTDGDSVVFSDSSHDNFDIVWYRIRKP